MRLASFLVVTLVLTATSSAQQYVELDAATSYPGAATYADLVRLAVADLTETDGRYTGTFGMALTSLIYPDDAAVEGVQVSLTDLSALPFTSGGTPHLALMLDSASEFFMATDILVVVELSDPPRLVDFADITADQNTSFGEPALLELGSEDDGLLISSSHSNSSQGYKNTTLVALVDGKLTTPASVFTLRENYCGLAREQVASFAPIATLDRWPPFAVTVTEATLPLDDDCGDVDKVKPGTRSVAVTYIWDEATGSYKPDSDALEVLYTETEARF